MLSTYRRLDRVRLSAWWRSDLPAPLYVLNLIEMRRPALYRAYGASVLPLLLAHGGRLVYAGLHERALVGESQAEELLIVRYASQRRFAAMVLNPLYQPTNVLRRAAVERFQAGFMGATARDGSLRARPALAERGRPLRARPALVVAHLRGEREAVDAAIAGLAGELGPPALVLRQSIVFDLLSAPAEPADPNPPEHPDVALFPAPAEADEPPAARLAAAANGVDALSIQRYRTLRPRDLLPFSSA